MNSEPETLALHEFERTRAEQPDIPPALAAMKALTEVMRASKASTMMNLQTELRAAADKLKTTYHSKKSVWGGCEIFLRSVTRTSHLEIARDFEACKVLLVNRGENLALVAQKSRDTIAKLGNRFIQDGMVVLVHSYDLMVCHLLLSSAATAHKRFRVVVTEGRPDAGGYAMAQRLSEAGIPVTIIADSAVGMTMETVDMVLLGAEGVVENGGIINKIGSCQVAMLAKALNKPCYIASESTNFIRLYPLSQKDITTHSSNDDSQSDKALLSSTPTLPPGVEVYNPTEDYTPPAYITLLITDLGVLTPSAVSDELIKLWQ